MCLLPWKNCFPKGKSPQDFLMAKTFSKRKLSERQKAEILEYTGDQTTTEATVECKVAVLMAASHTPAGHLIISTSSNTLVSALLAAGLFCLLDLVHRLPACAATLSSLVSLCLPISCVSPGPLQWSNYLQVSALLPSCHTASTPSATSLHSIVAPPCYTHQTLHRSLSWRNCESPQLHLPEPEAKPISTIFY